MSKDISNQLPTTVGGISLVWFGAAVSIAEILTGTAFAPLGWSQGVLAILIGHAIGCLLMFAAALIGARTRRGAMDTVKLSFGNKGSVIFSFANVIQLIGWTAIMIYSGAAAANSLWGLGLSVWALIIGCFICIWIFIGLREIRYLNVVIMVCLFVLTLVMSANVFGAVSILPSGEAMSFGSAVELAVAMPLSWLPVISDYTRKANKPVSACAAAAGVYFAVSVWMYVIGMAAALTSGAGDITAIMLGAGTGALGLLVVVLSTVTTTFLDSFSAGASFVSLCDSFKPATHNANTRRRIYALIATVLGTLLAITFDVSSFEGLLYFIGSVFAPMAAILIVDHFILHADRSARQISIPSVAIWAAGFVLYRLSLNISIPIVGNTVVVMIVCGILAYIIGRLFDREVVVK